MKLVTALKMEVHSPENYVEGKCNIVSRGRAIRLSTGLVLVSLSVFLCVTLMGSVGLQPLRLFLAVPVYLALLSLLEALMCFCVFQASRGPYDFFIEIWLLFGISETGKSVDSVRWRAVDWRKARQKDLRGVPGKHFSSWVVGL